MNVPTIRLPSLAAAVLLSVLTPLSGCRAGASDLPPSVRMTEHRGDDDLLSAGLGLAGLQSPIPPAAADPAAPSAAELRRRAIWSNWRGIADLAPGGGFGDVYGAVPSVPGIELQALLTLPGAQQPHRVLLQLPDAFWRSETPCLVVTAASGSRGAYGAIAIASGWGLPRGCAVVSTDKGAGSGWFDTGAGLGARLDGTPGRRSEPLEFAPDVAADGPPRVLFKHAHSGDNPEADWGRHLQQAAEFALNMLNARRGERAPLRWSNLTVLALGISNGGGAVLRAAELGGDWLDGAVAVAPNIQPGEGGRPLYDLATEAALLMPCALADRDFDQAPMARPAGTVPAAWRQRCTALAAAGLVAGDALAAQAADAHRQLAGHGWSDAAIASGSLSVTFDLWRAVAAGYAPAYARSGSAPMPCGYDYAVFAADGRRRAATPAEVASWWSDGAGIPPALGVQLVDGLAAGDDPALPGLRCLRVLWTGDDALAQRVQTGVAATRAALPAKSLPLVVVHGIDDGLVPEAPTSAAYVDWVRAHGRRPVYWRVHHAEHFDAFLGVPALATRFVPILPYGWAAMDALWAHLTAGASLPADAEITPQRRTAADGSVTPLTRAMLALPDAH